MGALTGAGVGLTIGFIFGSYTILRYVYHLVDPPHSQFQFKANHRVELVYPVVVIPLLTPFYHTRGLRLLEPSFRGGAGPRGAMSTLSQYMLSSAATFGFFLSIGSVSLFTSTPLSRAPRRLVGSGC
jgi:hypothetical protein